jgi:hypothetical protein
MRTLTLFLLSLSAFAQPRSIPLSAASLKPVNVAIENTQYRGRSCVRVSDTGKSGDGKLLALVPGAGFQDGVIELDLAGAPGPGAPGGARGFVGLAFRVQDDPNTYDAFYLRPANGRAEDQVRRNHSTQYISHPEWTWSRLREEFPKKYESYVDLAPGEWTRGRIEVRGEKARLYVHGAEQPCLIVNDLKQGAVRGGLALWIGPGTVAHFANLRIAP